MGYIGKIITKVLIASQCFYKQEMSIPKEMLMKVLAQQKFPKDMIDRSYNQYVCHNIYISHLVRWFYSISSFIIAPCFLIVALIRGLFVTTQEQVKVIGNFVGFKEIIPDSLNSKYDIDTNHWSYKFSLSFIDLKYLYSIWSRHPFSSYFFVKCLFNVAKYSDMIRKYNPEVLINHTEFSFTSSVLTEYCRMNKIKHINVMHGEKCFCIRDSFFEFDECYVWDDFYARLFKMERCTPNQFKIEVPPSLRIDVRNHKNPRSYADYKYYLWEDDNLRLRKIYNALCFFKKQGKSVKFRLHPRYCDISNVSKVIPMEEIENPQEIGIIESISNTSCVVGFLTTVMVQAFYSNIPLLIDDIAYGDDYIMAKEYNYMLASLDVPLLSSKIYNDDVK